MRRKKENELIAETYEQVIREGFSDMVSKSSEAAAPVAAPRDEPGEQQGEVPEYARELQALYDKYIIRNEEITADELNAAYANAKKHPAMKKQTAKQYPEWKLPVTGQRMTMRGLWQQLQQKWYDNLHKQPESKDGQLPYA